MAADSWLAIMDRFLTLGDESAKQKHEMNKNMLKLTDIYYDALDAPKKGAKVDLPPDLQVGTFPHYMDRKKKKFKSTSILGLIFDTVDSHNAAISPPSSTDLLFTIDNQSTEELIQEYVLTVCYNSEISKLTCFEDEPVPESHMEKCRRWYKNYREDMNQAMMERDENKKKQLTNEVNKRYKLVSFSIQCKDLKNGLHEAHLFLLISPGEVCNQQESI